MRKKLVKKCLQTVCLLATGLCANMVFASWYGNQSQGYSNQQYGNFPPLDIDQQIQDSLSNSNQIEESQSQDISDSDSDSSYQPVSYPAQNNSEQSSQKPNYGSYNRDKTVRSRGGKSRKKSGSDFSGPWSNNGSGFSAPWSNNGSDFNAPWNNRGSGFSMPWNNNGSGFSPWSKRSGR